MNSFKRGDVLRFEGVIVEDGTPGAYLMAFGDHVTYIGSGLLATAKHVKPTNDAIKNKYSAWPIDSKVDVWDENGALIAKGYFAGVSKDGHPLTWQNGATSWSASGFTTEWENAELIRLMI